MISIFKLLYLPTRKLTVKGRWYEIKWATDLLNQEFSRFLCQRQSHCNEACYQVNHILLLCLSFIFYPLTNFIYLIYKFNSLELQGAHTFFFVLDFWENLCWSLGWPWTHNYPSASTLQCIKILAPSCHP